MMGAQALVVALFAFLLGCSAQSNSDHTGTNPTQAQLLANDINTLNFALTLEQFGYAFYSYFVGAVGSSSGLFSSSSFANYGGAPTFAYLQMIRDHEAAHIAIIETAIVGAGGVPHQNCTTNFAGITTVDEFMATATTIENVCTMALDGAANTLYNKTLLTTAATLATVEGRHSAFLQYITTYYQPTANPADAHAEPFANYTGGGDGKAAFETPYTPAQVVAAVSATGLLGTCPFNLTAIEPSVLQINVNVVVSSGAASSNPTVATLNINDINALNYALTLEHLEAAFYANLTTTFDENDFLAIGLDAYDYATLQLIASHEATHVTYLTSVITALAAAGGTSTASLTPVAACDYNFDSTTFNASYTAEDGLRAYLAAAATFENVGVSAYDGAIATITDPVIIQAAATVATIEARHAAYLNYLNVSASSTANITGSPFYARGDPFPLAADTPLNYTQVVDLVLPFLAYCPVYPTQPLVYQLYSTVVNGTTNTTSTTTTTSTSTSTVTGTTTTTTGDASKLGVSFALASALALFIMY